MKFVSARKGFGKPNEVLNKLPPPSKVKIVIGNILACFILFSVLCLLSLIKIPFECEIEVNNIQYTTQNKLFLTSKKSIDFPKVGQRVKLEITKPGFSINAYGVIASIAEYRKNCKILIRTKDNQSAYIVKGIRLRVFVKKNLGILRFLFSETH